MKTSRTRSIALALAGVLVGAYRGTANIYFAPGQKPSLIRLLVAPVCGVVAGLVVVSQSRMPTRENLSFALRAGIEAPGIIPPREGGERRP